MALHVCRLALRVLLRRKVFTAISLFGVVLTLAVLLVATALVDSAFAARAPQSKGDRTLLVIDVLMKGRTMQTRGAAGWKLLDGHLRGLRHAEATAFFSMPDEATTYLRGARVESFVKRTDAGFWRVFDFAFVEGAPYTEGDDADGRRVAVINEATRRRLLGGAPALGRTIDLGGQSFEVVGVVKDVPITQFLPFSDAWVPIGTLPGGDWKASLRGDFVGAAVAPTRKDLPALQREMQDRIAQADPRAEGYDTLEARAELPFDVLARKLLAGPSPAHPGRVLRALILLGTLLVMALPALNLVNLSVSRIMERSAEIGVRKAFGASRLSLVGQFVAENVLLTLVGGALAVVVAAVVLRAIDASGLVPNSVLRVNLRVLCWGVVLALAFGVLSGAWPAWRMARLHPVEALRGRTA